MLSGLVEIIAENFTMGWAPSFNGAPAHVYATLRGRILGWNVAEIWREDLNPVPAEQADEGTQEVGRGFIVVFDTPVDDHDLKDVKVMLLEDGSEIPHGNRIKYDARKPLQIFILGSPRSGTSELGATLTTVLNLPWVGEGHAAPAFHLANLALNGEGRSEASDLIDHMKRTALGRLAEIGMRQVYYWVHASASFLDKTPGVAMIEATPFLSRCFPAAKFIFMRRNGISNVLSRVARFGGPFNEHCADWAAAMMAWADVKKALPSYLEVDQESMLELPEIVGSEIAAYLDEAAATGAIGSSLRAGSRERTGAGIGRTTLAATGWTEEEIAMFRDICGSAMAANGYEF